MRAPLMALACAALVGCKAAPSDYVLYCPGAPADTVRGARSLWRDSRELTFWVGESFRRESPSCSLRRLP